LLETLSWCWKNWFAFFSSCEINCWLFNKEWKANSSHSFISLVYSDQADNTEILLSNRCISVNLRKPYGSLLNKPSFAILT
jgi:hypothetical protein